MSISYRERESAIKNLYEFEESNNMPANQRLTYNPYVDVPGIQEASPRKKPYVDIRDVIERARNIKS